jgi:hypothetical protein
VGAKPGGGYACDTAMPKAWSIFCDCPELAVDLARDATRIGLLVEPEVRDEPWAPAVEALRAGAPVALAVGRSLAPDTAVELAEAASSANRRVPSAVIGPQPLGLLHDLGLPAVHETGPLLAVAALLSVDSDRPWAATTSELPAVDRLRLGESVSPKSDGRLVRLDDGLVGHDSGASGPTPLGTPRDVAAALQALRASRDPSRPKVPVVQGVESDAVMEVILGPRRALSDPASKAALQQYDVPLPLEELCATPSRAASESSRIGFPVRVALASPDLRLWDHPDLAAEVYSGGQARDAFRQIMAVAKSRSKSARLLGVTVSASTMARTLLHVRMEPLSAGPVLTEIGFADPHGRASADTTQTVLPASSQALERVLLRLRGSSLLLAGTPHERSAAVSAIGDVLMRLASFVHQWRNEIEAVEVNPLAILVGGELEIREACVTVGDAFSRSLNASG